MTRSELEQLAEMILRERDGLLSDWRRQVRELPSAKHLDTPTLNDHIPDLLTELADALRTRSTESIPENLADGSPPAHGMQRVADGFDIAEVVAEYNILRGCVHDLAFRNGLNLHGTPFHVINRVLDSAIGLAVQTFANRQAAEVQRRRDEYLTFVAHDLRTPLNAISIAAQVLGMSLRNDTGDEETTQLFKSLQRNVQNLQVLVNKVLEENTHLQSDIGMRLERRTFDLWPLIGALLHDLHPLAETAGTRLVNRVPHDLSVYADAGAIRRVFQNLIANAIKYTPGGEVIIGGHVEESAVVCWVSDNGSGIPEALLDRVFDKGETDHLNEGGTGLGLAIVKTFVEGHGGSVAVESKQDRGSTFRLTLPLKPA